jgi:hypothetical protein
MYDAKTKNLSRCEHTAFQLKIELSEVATPAWGLATSEVIYNLKDAHQPKQIFEEGTK